ncbi:MAG: flavocytochrome c [Synergistaceae bacterium]|nr:flavocytochrome c [Synergistaceae bacterium]
MKKVSALAAVLVLALCASAFAYTPGTYTATAKGNNANVPVEVSVTFDAEKITAIEVTKHEETPGLGDKAFELVIPRILEAQSTKVDGMTGATMSSNALKEAVDACIAQASGKTAEIVETFKPGTYTATVTGHNGPLTVTMTFSEKEILSLKTEDVESPGIGISAIEILTSEILSNQSLACDAVSGATVTSGAFLAAVRECIKQTGITASVLEARKIAYPEKKDAPVEMEADVIIVGAGGAGFAAATEALENGATVIILEKNEMIGGNTARAGGTLNAPDPERQSKMNPPVEDSVEKFFMNTLEAGDFKADPALVAVLTRGALDARHWLTDHGTVWTEMVYQTIGGLWPRSLDEKDKIAFNGFVAPLAKRVAELGGKVILNCKAESLTQDESGRVTGVIAFDTKNGQEYRFTAKKGVVLATGGYAASAELVKKYNGLSGLPTSNAPTSTGDGIEMGLAAGAALEGMEYVQIHPHGNPVTGGLQSHFAGVIKNSIYVNKNGKRFVEESGRRDVISNATIAQPGQIMYSIFDSEGGFYAGVKELPAVELNNLTSKGYLYKADTLEDLAKQAGIDPEGLKATVARYNELVAAGKDTDFEKDEVELPIGKAPFYCVPLSPTLHHTMGGLKINTEAQVLREDGSIIAGLYAAGEVTGGIHGSNRVGGNALTDGVVFGRIAGRNAAAGK